MPNGVLPKYPKRPFILTVTDASGARLAAAQKRRAEIAQAAAQVVEKRQHPDEAALRTAPLADAIVPRLSDDQLRDALGLTPDFDVGVIRRRPADAYLMPGGVGDRMDALRLMVQAGKLTPANDESSNKLLSALQFVGQTAGRSMAPIFKALELYDQYVAMPFTAVTVDLLERIIPSTADIERLAPQYEAQGMTYAEARVKAFEDSTDYPDWVKGAMRFVLDPLIVGGVVRAGPAMLRRLAVPVAQAAGRAEMLSAAETMVGRYRMTTDITEATGFPARLNLLGNLEPSTPRIASYLGRIPDTSTEIHILASQATPTTGRIVINISPPVPAGRLLPPDFKYEKLSDVLTTSEIRGFLALLKRDFPAGVFAEGKRVTEGHREVVQRLRLPPAAAAPAVTKKVVPVGGAATVRVAALPSSVQVLDMVKAAHAGRAKLPPVVERIIDPRRVAKGLEEGFPDQALIAWSQMNEMGTGLTELAVSHVRAIGETPAFFRIVEGRVLNVKGAPAWGDLFQAPHKYALIAPQQQYIKEFHNISDEVLAMFKREGIEVAEIDFLDGAMHYVSRRVVRPQGPRVWELKPVGRVGNRAPFEKSRVFDTMEEGLKVGERYDDPTATLRAYVRSAYKRIADKRLEEMVRPLSRSARAPGAIRQAAIDARTLYGAAKTGVAALQRALRGEVLPGPTVAALTTAFPHLADKIGAATSIRLVDVQRAVGGLSKEMWQELGVDRKRFRDALEAVSGTRGAAMIERADVLQAVDLLRLDQKTSSKMLQSIYEEMARFPAAERTLALSELLGEATVQTATLQQAAKEAAARLTAASKEAAFVGRTEGTVRSPAFMGRIFSGPHGAEVAARIEKVLLDRGSTLWKAPAELSSTIRTLRTTTDFSTPFIQGLPVLFRMPNVWAKATAMHYAAFFDKGVRSRYIAENAPIIADLIRDGGILGSSEFMEGLRMGGWLAKVPGVAKGLERFQSSFELLLDVSRIEGYKALRPTALRSGKAGATKDLAAFLNKMTGTLSTAAMGIPLSQRQAEAAWLLFAPRYTRAMAALFLDIFRGGLRGNEARKTLGSMFVVGGAAYTAVAMALGQEPNLDPSKGKFLRVRMGDQWVGVGGKMRSFLRLGGDVVEASLENPLGVVSFNALSDKSLFEHPLVQWMRSSGAPAPATLLDMITGVDVIGRKIPLDDPIDYTKFVGTHLLPFAFAGSVEQGQLSMMGASAEMFGAVVAPVSEMQKRNALRDQYAQADLGRKWDALALDERGGVEAKHPDLVLQTQTANVESARFVRNQKRTEAFGAMDDVGQRYVERLNLAAQEFDAGVRAKRGLVFRGHLRDAMQYRVGQQEQIQSQYAEVFQSLKEYWASKVDVPIVDRVYSEYMERVYGDEARDVYGNYDYEKAEAIRQQLRVRYGDEVVGRVEEERARRKRNPESGELAPTVLEYYDAVDLLRPYWDIWKTALTPTQQAHWQQFLALDEAQQQQLVATSRIYRSLNDRIQDARQRLRLKNQDVDWALVRFYDNVPVHPRNVQRLRQKV